MARAILEAHLRAITAHFLQAGEAVDQMLDKGLRLFPVQNKPPAST